MLDKNLSYKSIEGDCIFTYKYIVIQRWGTFELVQEKILKVEVLL